MLCYCKKGNILLHFDTSYVLRLKEGKKRKSRLTIADELRKYRDMKEKYYHKETEIEKKKWSAYEECLMKKNEVLQAQRELLDKLSTNAKFSSLH